jgi:peptide/nickel transport system substrate-binding protein
MKTRVWLILAVVIAMLLTACAPAAAPGSAPAEAPAEAAAPSGAGEFHGAYPYPAPPNGHFNTFVTNGFNMSIYHFLLEPPLFMYMWADQSWRPLAGESWEWVDDTTLRVKLPAGAVWNDGAAFTSKDVVDTFTILRLQNTIQWTDYLTDVVAVDDNTVDFIIKEPSNTAPRRLLRDVNIRSSAIYSEWADKVRALVDAGKTIDDQEWKDLTQQFNEFRPADMVVLGPYKIDPASITEAQMTLNKVPTSHMAANVKFDKIVIYNGETPTVTPLVLAGDVDYATHGFPPATEKEYIEQGIRILRPPNFNGPALYLNHTVHPFEMKEFRQALAYAIDRQQNGTVSLGESGKPPKFMAGFSDNIVPGWLSAETQGALNPYALDLAKAEEILTGIGFTRDSDGVWMDEAGKRLEFELSAPAEFADWSAAAENLAQQLTDFGVKTVFRGVNFQQHDIDVQDGKFQLAIRAWGQGNPHPSFSYNWNLRSPYNQTLSGVGDTSKPGISFPLQQTTDAVGDVDLGEMVVASGAGNDTEAQKVVVSDLALAYNELLPQIPLWERYGNNPLPDVRVTGWPADDDPIYLNGAYNDPFVALLILDGTLMPK